METNCSKVASRGFFEIGIFHGKTEVNIGTLWRSAFQLGAAGIFTIGRRYKTQSSDTVKAARHIPLRNYNTVHELIEALPDSCPLIGIEMGGPRLEHFSHPPRACYLLGAEDHGLPDSVLQLCHRTVSIGSMRTASFNVAVAGSLVMYDRMVKMNPTTPENIP